MDNFHFTSVTRVSFGAGIMAQALEKELGLYGPKVMLGYGGGSIKRNGIYETVLSVLKKCGKTVVEFPGIMPNPTYSKVQEGVEIAKSEDIDLILAVGGGSVSDCCKIVAAQAKSSEDIWESETVNGIYPLNAIPLGVVVTVAGTGSEQNNDAVITNEEKHVKCDLYAFPPEFSILDPQLTATVPLRQMMAGAFDSLSHAMETYFGKPSETFISDEINEAVMRNIVRNMRKLHSAPDDISAREELMWDSALAENGILKLGKTGDFQCHMIEHQLGAYTDCSHGEGLAVLHPVLYSHLLRDNTLKFKRFAEEVWRIDPIGKKDLEVAAAGIEALKRFIGDMGLPQSFKAMGLSQTLSPEILRKIAQSTITREGCARQLSPIEIFQILKECC